MKTIPLSNGSPLSVTTRMEGGRRYPRRNSDTGKSSTTPSDPTAAFLGTTTTLASLCHLLPPHSRSDSMVTLIPPLTSENQPFEVSSCSSCVSLLSLDLLDGDSSRETSFDTCDSAVNVPTASQCESTLDHEKAVACLSELLLVLGVSDEVDESPFTFIPQGVDDKTPPLPYPDETRHDGNRPSELPPLSPLDDAEPSIPPPCRPERRSIFDLGLYQPPEPFNRPKCAPRRTCSASSLRDGPTSATTLPKAPSACSMAGFYPRPEPGKSLLKRDTSVGSHMDRSLQRSPSTVSFSNLEIRDYSVALSDHPDCSYGPPIQLGWKYNARQAVSVDEYELLKHHGRRTGRDLLLTSPERRDLLLEEGGYTKEELQWAWQEVERVKLERRAAANGTVRRPSCPAATHTDWWGQLWNWIR